MNDRRLFACPALIRDLENGLFAGISSRRSRDAPVPSRARILSSAAIAHFARSGTWARRLMALETPGARSLSIDAGPLAPQARPDPPVAPARVRRRELFLLHEPQLVAGRDPLVALTRAFSCRAPSPAGPRPPSRRRSEDSSSRRSDTRSPALHACGIVRPAPAAAPRLVLVRVELSADTRGELQGLCFELAPGGHAVRLPLLQRRRRPDRPPSLAPRSPLGP
jgi:hypothetical protein